MAVLTLKYTDEYLKQHITSDRETRAFADVDNYGTFPDEWRNKLTIIRAYILVCLEVGGPATGLFQEKLKAYRMEFDKLLPLAQAAARVLQTTYSAVTSLEWGRG